MRWGAQSHASSLMKSISGMETAAFERRMPCIPAESVAGNDTSVKPVPVAGTSSGICFAPSIWTKNFPGPGEAQRKTRSRRPGVDT